jgi:thiamine biosynthesis protein ThiI
MKEIIMAKGGEFVLKGLNRGTFQNTLISNIRRRLKSIGKFDISCSQSAVYIVPLDEESNMDEAFSAVGDIFGISSLSRAAECEKDMDIIKRTALSYAKDTVMGFKTFKVEARRADKTFPLTSPQIEQDVGAFLLENIPGVKVDVFKPEIYLGRYLRLRL